MSTPWNYRDLSARLVLPGLVASLHLDRPQLGLSNLVCRGQPLPGRCLGVVLDPSADAPHAATLALEPFARGTDLVATYAAPEGKQVQIYWRAVLGTELDPRIAAIDLIVSVKTDRLDGRPELETESVLPGSDCWQLADAASGRFVRATAGALHAELPSCVVVRDGGGPCSYVEMAVPADVRGGYVSARPLTEDAAGTRLAWRLFPGHLEKGVIVRARLRGAFVPREGDFTFAAACYRQLLACDLPLTA